MIRLLAAGRIEAGELKELSGLSDVITRDCFLEFAQAIAEEATQE